MVMNYKETITQDKEEIKDWDNVIKDGKKWVMREVYDRDIYWIVWDNIAREDECSINWEWDIWTIEKRKDLEKFDR